MKAKFAQVIRGSLLLSHKLPFTARIPERHALYGHVRKRFTVLVKNPSRDHALWRQLENDLLEFLSPVECQSRGVFRAVWRVLLRNVQVSRSGKAVAARIDVVHQKVTSSIGCGSIRPAVLLPDRPQ